MNRFLFTLMVLISFSSLSYSQSAIGIWKNLDDTDGKEKSHIEIYEVNGKLEGKVIKLLPAASITHCDKCKGDNKGKSLVGMKILTDMKSSGSGWSGGHILDPATGKVYKCKMETEGADKLKVRGFIGVSLIGRTQSWYRVK